VIILCDEAEKNCPNIPSHVQHLYQAIDDPRKFKSEKDENILLHYRRIRDDIHQLVLHLPTDRG
jgi:hypothetical protein